MTTPPPKNRGRAKGSRSKTQDPADPSMRGRADSIRIAEALRMVTEGWTRVAAAEHCGLNVRTLYRHQKRAGLRDEDIQARSEETRMASLTPEQRQIAEAARHAAEHEQARNIRVPAKTQDALDDQRKRVPSDIVEFHDRYFGGIRCRQHLVHHELAPFHREMMRKIVDPQTKRLMINVPYGHELALDTPLLTADGWKTMGTVEPGDRVVGSSGKWVRVLGVSPVKTGLRCFEVVFSTGDRIVASADHHWETGQLERGYRGGEYRRSTVTTAEMAVTVRTPSGQYNHRIDVVPPFDGPEIALPLDPYILGYWLGDGSKSEPKIAVGVEDYEAFKDQVATAGLRFSEFFNAAANCHYLYLTTGCRKRSVVAALRELGVLYDKHIPDRMFRGSYKQRLALLQGLMDSDGCGGKGDGQVTFTEVHEHMAAQVARLASTLGYLPVVREVPDRKSEKRWCVYFRADPFVFRLARKAAKVPPRPESKGKTTHRVVREVNWVPSLPVRCITVDSPDHLFAAGDSLILTHNSKSTHGTLITSLHAIAHDPNVQIGIASATTRLAERFVGQIRAFLSDDAMYKGSVANLIEEAGPFVHEGTGRLGNNQEFRVWARESVDRDPTVAAYGYGQEIQSTRLDRLYCDDLATRKNHRTPERVQQMAEDVTQDYVSRLDENGQLILIGTRVKPGDLYSHLEDLPAFEVIRYPCVLEYQGEESEGRTLWPEHFGYDAAMRQKGGMRPELWELIYQNSTVFADGGTFTAAQLEECHDPTRTLGQMPDFPITCFIGVDPAGDGPQAGYTAMVLAGVQRTTGMRFLVDLVNQRSMKADQAKSQILDWCSRFPVHTVAIENKGVQRQIFDGHDFRAKLNETRTRLDATSHRTSDGRGLGGKYDPQWGIDAMSVPFYNRMWSIPWGQGRGEATAAISTRRRVGELEEQLMRFPMEGAPTDLMMALWIAESQILKHLGSGRRRLFSEREREEPLPADVEDRRRVHTRGEIRDVRARDFGYGADRPPRRLVNVGPEVERDINGY